MHAKRTLACVGQMAFTNYLAQSIICSLLFTGAGFGLFGQLERHQLYYIVAAIWIAQLLWSPWWLQRFRFGPHGMAVADALLRCPAAHVSHSSFFLWAGRRAGSLAVFITTTASLISGA